MKLILEMSLDDAACVDQGGNEVARILHDTATALCGRTHSELSNACGDLYDANGNAVGSWQTVREGRN